MTMIERVARAHHSEFLFDEIPEEYREALPGSPEFHREYDAAILEARDQHERFLAGPALTEKGEVE